MCKIIVAKVITTFSNKHMMRLKKCYISRHLKSANIFPTKKAVIIRSYVSYDHPMKQRPQQIADSLAKNGMTVIYLTPENHGRGDIVFGIKKISERLYVSDSLVPFLEYFKDPNVIIYSIDLNLSSDLYCLLKKHQAKIIYDYMDLLDEEHFLKRVANVRDFLGLQQILLRSDNVIVCASSDLILEECRKYKQDVMLIPNACDPQNFKSTKLYERVNSSMCKIIKLKKPIIGFIGALACWVDYDLIEKIALQNSHLSFVFIGPAIDKSSSNLKSKKISNIFFFGTIPFSELKYYTAWFDASLVPFKIADLTDAVSPVKLFEYMAVGKPIIGTQTREMKKYKSVLFVENAEDFTKKIDSYLEKKNDRSYLKVMQKELKENSWDDRAKKILKAIGNEK